MTTGKTTALTRGTFAGKVMSAFYFLFLFLSVCFLICLSRLVIAFLPRSKRLLFFIFIFFFSSTSLLLPTHLPPPSCTHAQSCNPMDCSPPGSSVHGFFQARILEWVAISFSMRLLISWLQSPSAVILEPKKIKSVTVSVVSSSICREVMELDFMILVY